VRLKNGLSISPLKIGEHTIHDEDLYKPSSTERMKLKQQALLSVLKPPSETQNTLQGYSEQPMNFYKR
jgi:hypothetical protein